MLRWGGRARFLSAVILAGCLSYAFEHKLVRAAEQVVHLVAPTDPKSPADQQKMFHLPPGFEIQLIAAEPAVPKPINMSFDAAGRLFVTQSIEYPFPPAEGTPRDTIKLITDTNGDGVPDKVSTFVAGLNIPIGVTPVNGAVLGYSIPSIYRFVDSDGDGRADKRDVAYHTFGFKDTHGMASSFTWWLDGWVYACHGFSNSSTVQGADGAAISMQSGNTYRFRPDGSHIEYVTHGQVNPFGLVFDALGNEYSADCHSKPISMLLRGGYYHSFGKPDDGLGFAPDMISHSHNSTGICGLVYYGAENFPPAYRDTVFIGNPVTGRVNHDRLELHGSTYRAVELPDFLSCDDPWFRPVDLKLAPDGSLYIADFYNRIIGHYEVPLTHPQRDRERGRIWRIVYTGNAGKPHIKPSDLTTASRDELLARLGDANIAVRTQATHQLVHRIGQPAADATRRLITGPSTPLQRAHGLWVLARLDALDEETIDKLAHDSDRLVRVHLVKALAGRHDWIGSALNVETLVIGLLKDSDAFVRRAAADALGQHPVAASLRPLLELWSRTPPDDTHLIHVVRMALRDTLQAQPGLSPLAAQFKSDSKSCQQLADVSVGIRSPEGAAFLLKLLAMHDADEGKLPQFLHHVIRYGGDNLLPDAYAQLRVHLKSGDAGRQAGLLRACDRAARERGNSVPADLRSLEATLTGQLLASTAEVQLRAAIDLAKEFKIVEAIPRLTALGALDARIPSLRQSALEALSAIDPPRSLPLLSQCIENADVPLAERQRASETLSQINTPHSRAELLRLLRVVPDQLSVTVSRGLASSRDGGEELLSAVSEGKVSARVLQDKVVEGRLAASNLPNLSDRMAKLLKDLPAEDERARQVLSARLAGFARAKPDGARGAELFNKTCANCHRLQGKGGKVGPDLDGIGLRGADRLLEDLLTPNRNVDQAFRSSTIALTAGKIVIGLVLREEGEVLIVVNEQGKEVRIAKRDIEEQRLMKLSPMPANIAEQLPEADLYHLVGYLLAQRAASTAASR